MLYGGFVSGLYCRCAEVCQREWIVVREREEGGVNYIYI